MSTLNFIKKQRKSWNCVDVRDKGPVFSKIRGLMKLSGDQRTANKRSFESGHLNMAKFRSNPTGQKNQEEKFHGGKRKSDFNEFNKMNEVRRFKGKWGSS